MTGATETEVKLRVRDTKDVLDKIAANGFRVSQPREFESNTLYDTPKKSLFQKGTLLRLRQAGERGVITWKGKSIPGKHKARPETETSVGSIEALGKILGELGYAPAFRYEKYRTEFRDSDPRGAIVFDETPIGAFLELEGEGAWIDETARRLGFEPSDYVLESYGALYRSYCAEKQVEPTQMVFPSS